MNPSERLANETLVPAVMDVPPGASALQIGQVMEFENGELWEVTKLMSRGRAMIKRIQNRPAPAKKRPLIFGKGD